MFTWLSGWKTVIVQVLAIGGLVAAKVQGAISEEEFWKMLWAALTIIFGAIKLNKMASK